MNRLVAIFQYNDALHKRADNPFSSNDGWDGTKGPWCLFTAIQIGESAFTSGRIVNGRYQTDGYAVNTTLDYNGGHRNSFKLEIEYAD